MLPALTRAAEARHPWTRGHAGRVADLAVAVARRLRWDEGLVSAVEAGSLLHDVGKLSLPPALLGKPGPLNEAEIEKVRTHPSVGARIVASLPEAALALPCVLHHHERWDGAGYPAGLAEQEIPLAVRLVSLADAFDAMTSHRPYRAARSPAAALAELGRCAGSQFDPRLAQVCIELWGAQLRVAV